MPHSQNNGISRRREAVAARQQTCGFESMRCGCLFSYCLMTINQAATIGPCGPRPRPPGPAGGAAPAAGAGAGPRSGWNRYALCVFGSTVIVFAPGNVSTVATTVYL